MDVFVIDVRSILFPACGKGLRNFNGVGSIIILLALLWCWLIQSVGVGL